MGKQPQKNIWDLNDNVLIDEDGNQLLQSESTFVWTPIGGPYIELMYGKAGTTSIDIKSNISTPLQPTAPLHKLLELMQAT